MDVLRWILGVIVIIVGFLALIGTMIDKKKTKKRGMYMASIIVLLVGFGIVPNSTSHAATSAPSQQKLKGTTADKTLQPSTKRVATESSSNRSVATSSTAATVKATSVKNTASSPTHSTGKLIPVIVSKNTDGDTIHVLMNGKDYTIRMLLIDTPEDVKPGTPIEPYSLQASAYAKQVLPVGKHIYIQEGKPGYTLDKYGRLLAYVFITKTNMYNEDVVRKGLARVAYIYPPNTDYLSILESDQSYAKSHHLGIWTIPGYVTSSGYSVPIAIQWDKAHHYGGYTSSSSGGSSSSSSGSSGHSSSSSSITVVSSDLTVAPGSYADVEIKTKSGATGSIEVDYKSGPSHAQGLKPQIANSQGIITWRWDVGTHTTPGTWPVHISVSGKSITVYLHVT